MFKFVMLSALVAGASAGYASSQYAGAGTSSGLYNQVNSGFDSSAYADKYPYTNTGYNGGFTSNFVGPNGVGAAAGTGAFTPGFAPFQAAPAFPNVFDFNGFYQGLQSNFANSATQAYATPGATAEASASQLGHYDPRQYYQQQQQQQQNHRQQYQQQDLPTSYSNVYNPSYVDVGYDGGLYGSNNLYQQQLAHQNALFNSFRQQQAAFAANVPNQGNYAGAGNYAGNGGGNYGAGAGFAGASAAYGPGGFHQTAQIYPQNPASPNINTRFGGDSQQGGPGFVGVSSFSSSSNINGQSHREASTSVNDNGKVTTYHVRS